MQRGIVVDIQSTHWVVMTSDGLFLEVPKQDPDVMTGEEVSFSMSQSPTVQSPSKWRWKGYFSGAVAAMFALFFLFSSFLGHEAQAQTHVYVEIHPGVEIGLNEKWEVVEVRPIHKEAEKLLDGLDWNKESVKQVVVNYLTQAKNQGYLRKKDEIVLSAINKNGNAPSTLDSLRTVINDDPKIGKKELDLHVFTFSLPEVIKEKAETTGLTPGKYGVWLLSKKSGKEIPVEQISKMPLSDLTEDVASLDPPPSEKEWKELVDNEENQDQKPVQETNQSETKPNTNTDQPKNTDQQTTNPTSDQKRTPNQEIKEDDSSTKDPNQKKEETQQQPQPNEKEENGSTAGSTLGPKGDSDAQTNQASP